MNNDVRNHSHSTFSFRTDAIVQKTIRKEFSNHTVLTIAHRLGTVIDSDKVIVMEAGQIVEEGSPYALLDPVGAADPKANPQARITSQGGAFASLVLQTGEESALELASRAREKFLATSK